MQVDTLHPSAEKAVSGFYKFNTITANTKQVTHSTALFLVMNEPRARTEVHFLNYWAIKRGVSNVTCHCVLRSLEGVKLAEESFVIEALKSYCLRIEELFPAHAQVPLTVIEVHIFSEQNLFIPYPAMLVRYIGPNWHSGMHSTARYFYEDSADAPEKITALQSAEESNISLFPDAQVHTSIVVHNGPHRTVDAPAVLEVVNAAGELRYTTLPQLVLSPYETRLITLDDLLDYKTFLGNKRGMATLRYTTHGVFPRVMALHQHALGACSVEHSNFGASISADDYFLIEKPACNLLYSWPAPCAPIVTGVDIYPTYPVQEEPYYLHQTETDSLSNLLTERKDPLDKGQFWQHTMATTSTTRYVQMDYRHASRLPNRFHTSIYYGLENTPLPAIILDGPLPVHAAPIGTRWAPFWCDEENETRIFLCSRPFADNRNSTTLHITLIGTEETERIEWVRDLAAGENLELSMRNLLRDHAWKGGFGWIYIKFTPAAYYTVYFLSLYKNNSIMAGHAF